MKSAPHRLVQATALAMTFLVTACQPPDAQPGSSIVSQITLGAPADVGMSTDGVARIEPAMQRFIDEGQTAGIMTLVARRGTVVQWDAVGWRVLNEDPLERDDIFRIYSMTKPVTSTAIMMLVEENALDLDQPLAEIIPAFGGVEVYDEGATRAPSRGITVRDLLLHTSGLTYGVFGDTPVDRMYLANLEALIPTSGVTLEQMTGTISSLPLVADPGTVWNYSVSTDVLGRVVEVVTGMSLDDFFRTRIFEPLGMHDTAFHVPADKLDRFTGVYEVRNGELTLNDSPVDGPFTQTPSWHSGGGGLTSTAMDYLRFAQMMLNEGELDGVRLLQPETVREMRSNHLPDELMPISVGGPLPGLGFGLGFAVYVDGPQEGNYWWAGVANTWFWIDPVEEIIGFVWTQYDPFGGIPINPLMQSLVYDAVTEYVGLERRGSGGDR